MQTADQCRIWAELRLVDHRSQLELMTTTQEQSIAIRARIHELKELLAAIRNEKPPVWIDPDD